MQKLHLVGFTAGLDGLILSVRKGSSSGGFVVDLDDALVQLVGDAERVRTGGMVVQPNKESRQSRASRHGSALNPRELQDRLRAGWTVEEVADEAGTDIEWVNRFAAPVRAEQARVVDQALTLTFDKPRLGPSSLPLGPSVRRNLAERGLRSPEDEVDGGWSAFQLDEGLWVVRYSYTSRGRAQQAEWLVDLTEEQLLARDRLASQLGHFSRGRRAAAASSLAKKNRSPARKPATRRVGARSSGAGMAPADAAPAKEPGGKQRTPGTRASAKKKAVTAKKASAKKKAAPAKKAPAKKKVAPAKRSAPAKKAPAKKAPAKRSAPAKRAPAKKAPAKKAPAKKAPAKRSAPAKKAPARKAAPAKRLPAKRVPAKRVPAKRASAGTLPARETSAWRPTPAPPVAPPAAISDESEVAQEPSTPEDASPSVAGSAPSPATPASSEGTGEVEAPEEVGSNAADPSPDDGAAQTRVFALPASSPEPPTRGRNGGHDRIFRKPPSPAVKRSSSVPAVQGPLPPPAPLRVPERVRDAVSEPIGLPDQAGGEGAATEGEAPTPAKARVRSEQPSSSRPIFRPDVTRSAGARPASGERAERPIRAGDEGRREEAPERGEAQAAAPGDEDELPSAMDNLASLYPPPASSPAPEKTRRRRLRRS